jgi:DNA-binding NtrC family response regulator
MVEAAKTILIVEDDPAQQRLYEALLQSDSEQAWQVRTAKTVDQALVQLDERNFDVVLLDQHLQDDRSGMDLLIEMQGKPAVERPAVVMLTSEEQVSVAVSALRMGAVDYLLKSRLAQYSLPDVLVNAMARREWQRSRQTAQGVFRRVAEDIDAAAGLVTEDLARARAHLRSSLHDAMAAALADGQQDGAGSHIDRAIGALQDLEEVERQVVDLIEKLRQHVSN